MRQRRSIKETVAAGITTLAELQEALLTAIQLEFSTIPPYLCAQWSIQSDPSQVGDLIQSIVVQEMLHFGLNCNMYTATGGSLQGEIASETFVPTYPTYGLPGGVHPGLVVNLLPVGNAALQTFMSIEYPEGNLIVQQPSSPPPPTAPAPPTIGQFYQTVAAGFQAVFPTGNFPPNPSPNQVSFHVDSDELFRINTVADALNAISIITDQGEGSSASPDAPTFDRDELAHYYTFAEIYYGKAVTPVGGGFQYAGDAITMPTVFNFAPQQPNASDQTAFIQAFSSLLTQLESCWTSGGQMPSAVGVMFKLQQAGTGLIQAGATPQFTFQAANLTAHA